MKALYLWMNRNMKLVAVCYLFLAVPAMILPDLFVPMVGVTVVLSLFFLAGDYWTGWWDAVKPDIPD